MTTTTPVTVSFADGSTREVAPEVFAELKGLDADGNLVIAADWNPDYCYALTPCCQATGKGSDSATGVVCRNCYREVDPYFGGPATVATQLA